MFHVSQHINNPHFSGVVVFKALDLKTIEQNVQCVTISGLSLLMRVNFSVFAINHVAIFVQQ